LDGVRARDPHVLGVVLFANTEGYGCDVDADGCANLREFGHESAGSASDVSENGFLLAGWGAEQVTQLPEDDFSSSPKPPHPVFHSVHFVVFFGVHFRRFVKN